MEKEKKDLIYKTVISGVILMAVLLGITYAYFTSGIQGDPSDVHGDTSKFIINLITENDGYINASELNLVKANEVAEKSEKGSFRVETGNNKNYVSYDLGLTSLNISANLQVADFKWALINTDSNTTKASGSFSGVNGTKMTLATGIVIAANKVDNYELRIWIEETQADQISLLGGTFSGKVILEASMIYNPIESFADKIIPEVQPSTPTNPNFSKIAPHTDGTQISGIYAMPDDYGTSYYYRGAKDELNNNLIFGGFQWKIVRINGDGSIRIIYNGTCPGNVVPCNGTGINNVHANTVAGSTLILKTGTTYTHAWNTTNFDDNKYVGYMYGGANGVASTQRDGTISAASTYNETSSNAKTELESWYAANIASQGPEITDKIVDRVFCNDRRLQSEVGGGATGDGFGNSFTNYAASQRYLTKKQELTCANKNDSFTVTETTTTNGALTYPVGLITTDEADLAGQAGITSNTSYYLYTAEAYWSFSPRLFTSSGAGVYCVNNVSSSNSVNGLRGLRPVINLDSNIEISGDGSIESPFIVAG